MPAVVVSKCDGLTCFSLRLIFFSLNGFPDGRGGDVLVVTLLTLIPAIQVRIKLKPTTTHQFCVKLLFKVTQFNLFYVTVKRKEASACYYSHLSAFNIYNFKIKEIELSKKVIRALENICQASTR